MLIKKELETIPVLEYPALKKIKEKYVAAASIVNLSRSGEILVIDVFSNNTKELFFRFFSDKKSFLIYVDTPKKEWIKRQPNSMLGYANISNSEEDLKKVTNFFKRNPEFWYYCYSIQSAMEQFVSSIYAKRNQQASERKYDLMQQHFEMFPSYPQDLAEYCESNIFKHTYIFVSKIIKDKRRAVCGCCGYKFKVDKSEKPGVKGKCPKCGKSGTHKGDWTRGKIEEKADICIAQKKDNQLLLRWTKILRTFSDSKCNYDFDDFYRSLYLKTDKGEIIYSYQYQPVAYYGWDWYRKKNGSTYYGDSFIYTNNLREVFGETYYHVDLQDALKNSTAISFISLLDNLKNIPATEYLVKMNLISLAVDIRSCDIENNKGFAVLGVSKQYLKLYQMYNVNLTEHRIIKASKTWVSENSFEKLRSLEVESWYVNDINKLLDTMSFEHFVNYFSKQKALLKRSLSELISYYKDYISMAETLKVDLSRKSVRYPDNIRVSHDLITTRFNEVKHKVEDENFKQAIEKLYAGMKEYAKGDYLIVFPTSRTELITEGQSLNHCVGNEEYYKRHIEGSRMIFFIRKVSEQEKPYFTMEIDMKELIIRQLYGFGDCSAPAEVKKFANEFLRKLKPNFEEERKAS